MRTNLENSNRERDDALAATAQAQSQRPLQGLSDTTESGQEEGQIDESRNDSLSDAERKTLEDRIVAAEAKAKEAEEKAASVEEQINETLKTRSEKMKNALNKRLAESRETQKASLEEEYKLKFEQEKQILLAELKTSQPSLVVPAAVALPSTPQKPDSSLAVNDAGTSTLTAQAQAQTTSGSQSIDWANISDSEARKFVATNSTAKSIMTDNIKKQAAIQTQKLKEEHEKAIADKLSEAKEKAEVSQAQAVSMIEKRMLLKANITDNRLKLFGAKWKVIETAAEETPLKPIKEVYEVAKDAKPPPNPPASAAAPLNTSSMFFFHYMHNFLLTH